MWTCELTKDSEYPEIPVTARLNEQTDYQNKTLPEHLCSSCYRLHLPNTR
jgi:hypothetical protein